jgi:putative transposase
LDSKVSRYSIPGGRRLLASLLADYKKPEDLMIGENGLLKQLTKLLVEKALDAELTEHIGYG